MRLPRFKWARPYHALLAALALFVLAGCSSPQDILAPASPPAGDIAGLFYLIFWVALFIFVLVEGLLVFFVIRYRRRAEDEYPEQYHGNTKLEATWTAIPALILIVVFAFTVRTMAQAGSTAAPAEGMPIQVTGHQWWWEVQYPEAQVVSATEIHIPAGKVVNVELTSVDVIHSFWVPSLMGKTDTIPGHVNKTWLYSTRPGTYYGQCAEFCGTQHARMLFRVVVQPQEEFDAWLKSQQQPPVTPAPGSLEAKGQQLFLSPEKRCIGCHAIQGTNAVGVTGPNLTHFASRACFAGCLLPTTTENLTRWLENPEAVKPGTLMKIPQLQPDEIQALVAYLESLK